MKRRVLFVDDEPRLLESLSRSLHHRKDDWSMEFISDGAAAYNMVSAKTFDVIVCDQRMIGLDGRQLLTQFRHAQPDAVRIVVANHAERAGALDGFSLGHQYVSKPYNTNDLEHIIERSCLMKGLLEDGEVMNLVGSGESLPSVPRIYMQLTEAMGDPEVSIDDVARIVSQDPALCARLLKVANSAFFGLRRQITNVRHAIVYLGMRVMRQLVFSVEVYSTFHSSLDFPGFTPEALQQHSLLTARIATDILGSNEAMSEHAFMSSMLHDLGKVILACNAPGYLEPLLRASYEEGLPLHAVERREEAISHAHVGAYLIGQWGLPYSIVEAVAFHHEPWKVSTEHFDLPGILYVANELSRPEQRRQLDEEYLESVGVAPRMRAWEMASSRRSTACSGRPSS